MFVKQICCIVLAGILAQVNGLTNIPNTYYRHNMLAAPNMHHRPNLVADPRVQALSHRIATLQRTLNELQKQRLHSRPRPLAPQPAPVRRVHHLPAHSQPLNYQIVGSPFTSNLLDRMSPKSFGPEAPFEYYTSFVPEPAFYD